MKKVLMASFAMCIFALAALLFQLVSCKKVIGQTNHECPPATYPVAGIYIGIYSVDSKPNLGNRYYSFAVFPDGSLLTKGVTEFGDTAYQRGNWTLSIDSIFTGMIQTFTTPAVFQTITGTFSNDGKISNAKWSDIYLSGKFSAMQRVN